MEAVAKRSEWIWVVIGVIAAAILAFVAIHAHRASRFTVITQQLPAAELPERFPANIPIEPGAPVLSNYTAQTPEGAWQSTRSFTTQKSLADNLQLYQDFFTKDGWTVRVVKDETDFKALLAQKDSMRAQVVTRHSAVTNTNTVEISVLTSH